MNYTSEDIGDDGQPAPRGEICYRGKSCFKGYYLNPEMTKSTIDADGWVHTGDIGKIDAVKGVLRIIDRKKNIFKLSQGEYIAPEKVENKLTMSPYIAQMFVYGDSLQHFLVAIIVPDKAAIEKWALDNGVVESDFSQLLKLPVINKFYQNEMVLKSREAGFFGFEIPQQAHLTTTAFSTENDLLTPTFKLKRNEAKNFFLKEIKGLYGGALLQGEEK